MMKNISLSRLLRAVLAMTLALAVLLCCGCAPKEEPTNPNALGDGDGKLETQDLVDGFTTIYGTALKAMGSQPAELEGTQTDLSVTLGEDVLSYLGGMLEESGLPADASWMKEFDIRMRVTPGDIAKFVLELNLGGTDIAELEAIVEGAATQPEGVYMRLPGLNDQYLGVITAAASNASQAMDYTAMVAAMPTEEALNTLLTRYLNILLEKLEEPTVGTETLQVGSVSQEVTATTYTIRRSQVLDIAEAMLKTAQTDAELEKMLDDYAVYYNAQMEAQYAEYAEIYDMELVWEDVDLHQEVLTAIADGLEELAELRVDLEDGDFLVLAVYADDDRQLGLSLKAIDGAEAVQINAYSLAQKDNTAFLLEVKDMFRLSGTGTESDGIASGYYTLSVMDTEMASVEVRNFDVEAMEKGDLKGELELRLSQTAINELFGYDSFVTTDTRLVMKLDMQGQEGTATYELYEGNAFLLRLTGTAKSVEAEKVSVPTDYVEHDYGENYDAWAARFDWEELRQRLRQAGVPEEVADLLQENLFGA